MKITLNLYFNICSLFFSCLFICSCSPTAKNNEIINLNNNQITVLGHAGSGFLSLRNFQPPNSYSSIKKALKNGALGVEVDVQLSKDSVPILFHDLELDNLTKLKGCISNYAAKELLYTPYQCGFFYDIFQDEKIISLEMLLSRFLALTTVPEIHLDLKDFDACMKGKSIVSTEIFAKAISNAIKKTNYPLSKISYISMNSAILLELQKCDTNYRLFLEEVTDFNKGLKTVIDNNFNGITLKAELLSPENTEKAHDNNKLVVAFGGSSSSSIEQLIQSNPDYIQANNVPAAVKLLN